MSNVIYQERILKIGLRTFMIAAVILVLLMIATGVFTRVVPAGAYEYRVPPGGETPQVVPGSFAYIDAPEYPVWRWFAAPVEVLLGSQGLIVITIILFLLFIGGAITILDDARVLQSALTALVRTFESNKYTLVAIVILFFMSVASLFGIYESMVPLIVLLVPVARRLGWDALTGLGMSLLPLGFGFAAAITNPFTVGVAQRLAGIPLFSGLSLRIAAFCVAYALVTGFVIRYARRIEADPTRSLMAGTDGAPLAMTGGGAAAGTDDVREAGVPAQEEHTFTPGNRRAVVTFALFLVAGFGFVFASAAVPTLSDWAFPAMAVAFLFGGITAGAVAGRSAGQIARSLGAGGVAMLPGVVLILLAASIQHIATSGRIIDTALFWASSRIEGSSPVMAVFMIYAVTLGADFFIGSASAKSFLLIPILAPLADLAGASRQTAVLAYVFGDGFSNLFYPTNALLLVGLSLTVVGYAKWIRWTLALQAAMAGVSLAFLAVATAIGY